MVREPDLRNADASGHGHAVAGPAPGGFVLFPIIIAIYYAGELVWRERDRRMHEIIDATPVPDWAYVVPKTIAVALVLVAALLISVVGAILSSSPRATPTSSSANTCSGMSSPTASAGRCAPCSPSSFSRSAPTNTSAGRVMVVYIVAGIVLRESRLRAQPLQLPQRASGSVFRHGGHREFLASAYWFRLYWVAFCGCCWSSRICCGGAAPRRGCGRA